MTETEIKEAIENKRPIMLRVILLGWIYYERIVKIINTAPLRVLLQDRRGHSLTVAYPKMVRYANESEGLYE